MLYLNETVVFKELVYSIDYCFKGRQNGDCLNSCHIYKCAELTVHYYLPNFFFVLAYFVHRIELVFFLTC